MIVRYGAVPKKSHHDADWDAGFMGCGGLVMLLNPRHRIQGQGVFETLREISRLVLAELRKG